VTKSEEEGKRAFEEGKKKIFTYFGVVGGGIVVTN